MTIKSILTIFKIFIFTFTFYGCSINNSNIDQYAKKFEKHKDEFENLVSLLERQNINIGFPVNENDLPLNIKKIIDRLEISNINISNTTCIGIIKYEFTSTWCRNATLFVSKDYCNREQTSRGYHSKISEMIEVWGLGNDWVIWIDYDFI